MDAEEILVTNKMGKTQKRRTVSMRPLVFQRLLDAAQASGKPVSATAEAAVMFFCEHHGIAMPKVARYLAEQPGNSAKQSQRQRREINELADWKSHFTW
jgi:hypothetical protein